MADDGSYLAQLIAAGTDDRRPSNYPVIPPKIGGGNGEKTLYDLPAYYAPDAEDDVTISQSLAEEAMSNPDRYKASEPVVAPAMVAAMRNALRPDLERMARPSRDALEIRRVLKTKIGDGEDLLLPQ